MTIMINEEKAYDKIILLLRKETSYKLEWERKGSELSFIS